jgi:hypothetical protein
VGVTLTPTSGNNLIAAVVVRNGVTGASGPAGWTKAVEIIGTSFATSIWYLENYSGSGAQTYTWTQAASDSMEAVVVEVSGLATSGSLDVTASNTSGTATNPVDSGTTATTATANEFWLAAMGSSGTGNRTISGLTAGWTQDVTENSSVATHATHVTDVYQIASATGTAHAQFTLSTAQVWNACVATFKAGASASTRNVPTSAALVATNTRQIPSSAALLATVARAVPASGALIATNTRSVPDSAALVATPTRITPTSAALVGTPTRTIPVSSALAATVTRITPASVALLQANLQRVVPTSSALVATNSRVTPVNAGLLATPTRITPAVVALMATTLRAISASAMFSGTAVVFATPVTARMRNGVVTARQRNGKQITTQRRGAVTVKAR